MTGMTMKDVAAALGVSVTSVSNAFGKPDRISAELRARIIAGAEELGYHGPDAAGRMLRSGRANALGVVFNERLSYAFADPYAVTLLAAFTEVVEQAGMGVNLMPVRDRSAGGTDDPGAVATAAIDGVVGLCAGSAHPGIVAATRRGLPVVLTDTSSEHDFVSIDDAEAGGLVGRHLARLGHRRVAIIHDSPGDVRDVVVLDEGQLTTQVQTYREAGWDDAVRRVEGIVEGLAGAHITGLTAGRNTRENGRRCAAVALDLPERPTALVAISDIMALGVLDEVRARGLQVGTDVSVAGFDGIPEALTNDLTTVRQPIAEKGRRAAQLLLDPEITERRVVLPIQLQVGSTTGPASAAARS